jgi:hypothetical protein
MKNLFLFLSLLFFATGCNKDSKSESIRLETVDENIMLRDCWWCISEDVLGMVQGATLGSLGGPMGAAVGGALLGAYKSIKEYNNQPLVTLGDSEDYLTYLAPKYTLSRPSNEFNCIFSPS